ncbi:hypothetical protein EV360DRAFT_26779, partial [Lentinula raphanica]
RIHNVFHTSSLIPWNKDTIAGQKQAPPPPVFIYEDGAEEREVERILKKRVEVNGVTEYLLQGKEMDEMENEWVSEENMNSPELL